MHPHSYHTSARQGSLSPDAPNIAQVCMQNWRSLLMESASPHDSSILLATTCTALSVASAWAQLVKVVHVGVGTMQCMSALVTRSACQRQQRITQSKAPRQFACSSCRCSPTLPPSTMCRCSHKTSPWCESAFVFAHVVFPEDHFGHACST